MPYCAFSRDTAHSCCSPNHYLNLNIYSPISWEKILSRVDSTLRRWSPSVSHVFRGRGLADINAELEQFAVNPECLCFLKT
jgi:hypothetical protein